MRLKTKLFFISVGAILLLWLGAFLLIRSVVSQRIDQMAQEAFDGTSRSLAGLQRERLERMQQAGRLVMNIPELRALIAEQNYELSGENRASLNERLDHLEPVVGASFICVLDGRQRAIAQSGHSPWASLEYLNEYCAESPQSSALIRTVFSAPSNSTAEGTGAAAYGLWPVAGRLYQVVAIPLIFQSDDNQAAARADGALVLAEQIDDAAALDLGRSHSGQVTFLSDNQIVASSLDRSSRQRLRDLYLQSRWPAARQFVFNFNEATLHGLIQPLIDPPSGIAVGQMLIWRDELDAEVSARLLRSLALIMCSGILAAAVGSFVISAAITRPVRELVSGVQKVAQGNLDLTLPVKRRDELGELATSFNDMVRQLRSRRELVREVEEAQSASRAKSYFLANMSHEIRTPLNGVIGITELMLGTPLSDQQRRYCGLIKTSGDLLTALINDILDFSKIEAGKLELETIDFDLHETVEDVVALLSERAARKRLELACHFHGDVPRLVRGDPDRLRQVLVNLVNNGIKFTTAGSVVVSVTKVSESEDATEVKFCVSDTGIGVPADLLDRLFKPFSQVDASTTRRFGGTGLGLAIAKQLAELMGGEVGCDSVPLRGSTFWFTAKLQKRHASAPASAAAFPNPGDLRVLAVDDSHATRTVLREQLATWGVRAETVGTAQEALVELRRGADEGRPYKIVLIDSDMPGTSGFELARMIKSDSQVRETILMALLPLEELADAQRLSDAGFAAHMTKPIRQSQLFDGLMRAVARDHAQTLRASDAAPAFTPPTSGYRILVAEDNEVNQIVVIELLNRAGYQCDVVDSGRKLIDAVFARNYDLVLMDCQMPEMDGFEAAQIIRQKESENVSSRRLPIIAVTANAMKGDRDRCIQSGMDAYCSKPIDAKHLLATVAQLLKSPPVDQALIENRLPDRPGNNAQSLPAIVVDTLLQRCLNNPAIVDKIIAKFEQQAQQNIEELRRSIDDADAAAVARIAHSLKGAASILAAQRVADAADKLETIGRENQLTEMEQALSRLRDEVSGCLEYLPAVRAIATEKLSAHAASQGVGG